MSPTLSVPKRLLNWGALCAIFGVLILSLAGLCGQWSYVCDLTVHFRQQYTVSSALLLGVFLWQRQRLGLWLSLSCLVLNLSQIAPWYWPMLPAQAIESPALRVMVSNVEAKNQDYGALSDRVHQETPDLLFLLEITPDWLAAIAPLTAQLPYAQTSQNGYDSDVAILSTVPLTRLQPAALRGVESDVQVARFEWNGVPGVAIAIHPPPPIYPALFTRRNRVLHQVTQYIQQLQAQGTPAAESIILGGDFNISPWSAYYRRLAQGTGLKNSRDGFGILPTWPTYQRLLGIPIDHCLVSPSLSVLHTHTAKSIGSDHLPIVTDLAYHVSPSSQYRS